MELLARVFDAAGPQAEAHWLAVKESLRANLETGDQGSSPG